MEKFKEDINNLQQEVSDAKKDFRKERRNKAAGFTWLLAILAVWFVIFHEIGNVWYWALGKALLVVLGLMFIGLIVSFVYYVFKKKGRIG